MSNQSAATESPRTPTEEELPKPILTQAQAKRANQSLKGMVISVLLTLAVVLPVLALNPFKQSNNFTPRADVTEIAAQLGDSAGFTPLDVEVPADWYANFARWKGAQADGVDYWEVGYVSEAEGAKGFVGLRQAAEANPTWVAQHAGGAAPSGERVIEGLAWTEYAYQNDDGAPQVALVAELPDSTVMLYGDAEDALVTTVAQAVTDSVG